MSKLERERLLTLVILCFINRREILLCRWVESAPRETIKACLVLNPVGQAAVTEHAVAAEGRRDETRREKGAVSAVSPAEEFRDSLFGGDNVLVGRPVPFSRLSFATVLVRAV